MMREHALRNRDEVVILQLLATRRRSFVPVDTIVETLWGDEAPAGGR